jgi:hypothetical protein
MTGPFVRVQEARKFGPSWINVARIVNIRQSSIVTTISLAGAGIIEIEEPAEAFVGRIAEALGEPGATPKPAARPADGARRGRARPAAAQTA